MLETQNAMANHRIEVFPLLIEGLLFGSRQSIFSHRSRASLRRPQCVPPVAPMTPISLDQPPAVAESHQGGGKLPEPDESF
jgi:hypothetical protein